MLALVLISLFTDAPPSAASQLKPLGIACVYVAPDAVAAWTAAGACAKPLPAVTKLPAPGVQYRMNVASASNAPWVNSNGWQYVRGLKNTAYVDAPNPVLAAAEAHAYGVDAILKVAPKDWPKYAEAVKLIAGLPTSRLPLLANIGFVDDGSPAAGENLNLLVRRNLLFKVIATPDPSLALNVKPEAGDPSKYAYDVRQKLGDDRRLLRIYGSDVVIARLQGDASGRRVTLLNYGNRSVEGLRVRLLGRFPKVQLASSAGPIEARDIQVTAESTEFSLPLVPTYTVIDLKP
ncbi:MAG: hypothetical protein B7X34_01490 [Acidobacteriia bacterium 12-62-4]|nr:MAG: hypothetical protein B7X34_01490 [Acidobacteriia bacterium 12-62-4]